MKKSNILLTIIIMIGIIIIGSMVYGVFLRDKFCEDKGYDWYHTNTEEGYIACCNNVFEEHINTKEYICNAFEFSSFWFT